jgi:hypothetical protein
MYEVQSVLRTDFQSLSVLRLLAANNRLSKSL